MKPETKDTGFAPNGESLARIQNKHQLHDASGWYGSQ